MVSRTSAHRLSPPVLAPVDARRWDQVAEQAGISTATLMDAAGRGTASVLCARRGADCRRGVLVAVGTGNNGGDGWVLARALHRLGIPVWVASCSGTRTPLAEHAASRAIEEGVRVVSPDGPWPAAGLLVDALLGTGARGELRGEVAAMVARLSDLSLPLVAIDGPTGLDLFDGVSRGPPPLRADLTITFGGYRRGHLLARDDVGTVVVLDIGLPPPESEWPVLFTDHDALALVPPIPAAAHKGTRGRVVVVGGTPGLSGAVRLAGRAAYGAGAGLVSLVVPPEVAADLAGAEPDLQVFACEAPRDGSTPLAPDIVERIARADAVVLGPGLGRERGGEEWHLVDAVLSHARAVVVDADGLVAAQGRVEALRRRVADRPAVLTPHAGEFRTLFPDLAHGLSVDPWEAAARAAELAGATVLLKGVPTVVARSGVTSRTIAAGNPGLATGGSGDVLSGIIAALLAQGVEAPAAAALGAHVLGSAADIAARRTTRRTLRPMEVIAALPDLWRAWDLLRRDPPPVVPPILHELPSPVGP